MKYNIVLKGIFLVILVVKSKKTYEYDHYSIRKIS